MSDEERFMNIDATKSPKKCGKCGMGKMTMDGQMKCPNCDVQAEPRGPVLIVTEPQGEHGPIKIQRVTAEEANLMSAETILATRKAAQAPVEPNKVAAEPIVPGTILLHVPVQLFPDLVMWSRKLKLPKDWKEAEKIKAITNFQIEINQKLGGIA